MKHVALLRGINVGGHHKIRMSDLRVVFEGLGFTVVQTYIQSGNVVFEAGAPEVELIEAAIEKEFGFRVNVILRSAAGWAGLESRNPYAQEADGTLVHVAFLNTVPDPAQIATICARPGNVWTASGREVYLHTPDGLGQSGLNLGHLKHATVRNWRTVQRLAELLG
ncbi:DUF1697 domain-containing protein [Deinococcus sp. AJ005]|uniref:DUF1697 domain-containing protein n=1 Tax=Deinococcus sp. AJ005 TaxID=2652443 RepID=UPI00125CB33E|nr:DUF1697 domain-containing protein [Deinococcus sp. AJ005]QFP77931.1 DUF1697 domain-containing protein [Deinococcus sp. AJ005]